MTQADGPSAAASPPLWAGDIAPPSSAVAGTQWFGAARGASPTSGKVAKVYLAIIHQVPIYMLAKVPTNDLPHRLVGEDWLSL